MNLQDILDPIVVFLKWIFINIFEVLGNIPNYLFIVVGFIGLFYWLNIQKKYNQKAEREGTLK